MLLGKHKASGRIYAVKVLSKEAIIKQVRAMMMMMKNEGKKEEKGIKSCSWGFFGKHELSFCW